ncbi:MAG: alpha/beta hydrolase [Solirubrobacteraceae bacterium]|nr:alpha/beta hydrolase [Patulibacter sp.]
MLRLRLFHAQDGARIAYREGGTGPPFVLWHSRGLNHREFTPAADELLDRVRIVLPDLPLHGDSEEAPGYPYDIDWTARLLAEFTRDIGGAHPRVGGSGLGAQLLLRAVARGWLEPSKLVLLPGRLHRPAPNNATGALARFTAAAVAPAGPLIAKSVAKAAIRPELVGKSPSPRVASLVTGARTAMLESGERSRAWRRVIAGWDTEDFRELIDAYGKVDAPTLVLWSQDDTLAPRRAAEEAADLIEHALLRDLPGTGPLLAYDDPVGLAREIYAFLRDVG